MTTSHACHMKRRDGVMIIHIVWFDTKWTTMISAKSYLLTQSRLRHEENRKSKAKAAAIGTAREKIVKNRKSPFWSLLFEERECFTSILFFTESRATKFYSNFTFIPLHCRMRWRRGLTSIISAWGGWGHDFIHRRSTEANNQTETLKFRSTTDNDHVSVYNWWWSRIPYPIQASTLLSWRDGSMKL